MMKAAAPMTGGISWPPIADVASTPAANSGRKPDRFINGMVNAPVVTAFAVALPLRVPNRPLEMTATLPAPPRVLPAMASAASVNRPSSPPCSITAPNRTNRKMKLADTCAGMPNTPSSVSICRSINFWNVTPPCARNPGIHGPAKA